MAAVAGARMPPQKRLLLVPVPAMAPPDRQIIEERNNLKFYSSRGCDTGNS